MAFGLALALASACSPARRVNRYMQGQMKAPQLQSQFTGLLLVDAQTGDTLFAQNALRPFTPASNVKLLTLYAGLKALPERVPVLAYQASGDTLRVWGTGAPFALHPEWPDSTAMQFMQGFATILMANDHLEDPAHGPGWSWDDFDQYYTPSRSAFPIYGNTMQAIGTAGGNQIVPPSFRDSIFPDRGRFAREVAANRFYLNLRPGDTVQVPLLTDPTRERALWAQALGREVLPNPTPAPDSLELLYGVPTDTLYRRMMERSDNFLAEQVMLLVSATLGDTLGFSRARDHALEHWLADLPQTPKWVDGSGLSRYNLISPASLVALLGKLYREIPEERLFTLMAKGGGTGTLRNWYREKPEPYVFGKTGSLSNNHNLSGYLRTRHGKLVLFSFMNNHYLSPTTGVKERMQHLLDWVWEHY
ncbi:D-alanyl-D-alanine carboxypeptidase/D-alanyl-D-alanine-endopeptidase [Robiginitalea sediminis]|uniref:D-alanyl-D-alanine carboxypeptidase/D-alanyl-D-alanine-endopeptidase n=1 Tax=Robiginitalea sediminis TaxID=1982593 RepID=UPI000B4C0431|nr:D-alanyl-D-alanine carboxypeptidase [Robiginitalea sediminis]